MAQARFNDSLWQAAKEIVVITPICVVAAVLYVMALFFLFSLMAHGTEWLFLSCKELFF